MTGMPQPTALFEAHLTVADLDRSIAFYRDAVGLRLALVLEERNAAFFWVGPPGAGMLGLWSLGSAPMMFSLHIALKVSLYDVLAACDALRANGITPLSFFDAEATEPSVIGWMPAAAVYFRDPDGHLVEYLAMLDEPARPERGIVTWSDWARADRNEARVQIDRYTGPRSALRDLFEEAEDSALEIDAYIDAGEVLTARIHGDVVGHLQLIEAPANDAAEIKNMAVRATHRGRGIGRALIDAAIDQTRNRGRRTLIVATAAADIGNLRFYQRAGFRMRAVERDAFTPAVGYPAELTIDGIRLLDRVWLDRHLDPSC
jgi:GNAT superfamily N-acetyltransferase/catechol 2,3-dioxygenase-like lactoylglutathione lyase family enzyme